LLSVTRHRELLGLGKMEKEKLRVFEEQSDVFQSLIPLNGKVPIDKGWEYYCDNSRQYNPADFKGLNCGIPCGPANGIIVLDVDDEDLFEKTCQKQGWKLPETRVHLTGKELPHYVYQYPKNGKRYGNRGLKNKYGIDIRGIGGQVVGPGSIHPETGRPYEVISDVPIVPAPQWLLDLALNEPETSPQADTSGGPINLESLPVPYSIKNLIKNGVEKGDRSDAQASVLCSMVRAKVPDHTIFKIFNAYPIGEKYREKCHSKDKWIQDEIKRARNFTNKNDQRKMPRGVSLGMAKEKFQYDQEIKFVWREVIPAGMPAMLAGREGSGKTTNAMQIGKEIVDSHNTGYVVWLPTEGAVLDTIDKADKLEINNPLFVFAEKSDGTYKFEFSRPADRNELDILLSELPGPILAVFIDSIRGMSKYGDSDDENGRIMHTLNSIVCDKHRAALIYLDHHKKGTANNLLDKTSGSTSKTSAVRLVLAIEQKSKLVRTIKPAKVNVFKEIPELESIQVGNKIHIRELTNLKEASLIDKAQIWLTNLMAKNKEIYASDGYRMAEEAGFSDSVLKRAKQDLPIASKKIEDRWKWTWEL